MSSYYTRGSSPPNSRRYPDTRASTGTVFASSFDSRYGYPTRTSNEGIPRVSERPYDAQPIQKKTYVDSGYTGGTTSTQYAIRPRHGSLVAEEHRRPLSIVVQPTSHSPTRSRLTPNSAIYERSRSPPGRTYYPRDDSERNIYPAATDPRRGHQRHWSVAPPEAGRSGVPIREQRERYYRMPAPTAQNPSTSRHPIIYSEEDGYSYTNYKEQFARDFLSQPAIRREDYSRRERPMSVLEHPDRIPPTTSRRDLDSSPPTGRRYERTEVPEPRGAVVRPGYDSDSERPREIPKRRYSMKNPVVHQDREEDYPPPREEYSSRRHSRHANKENSNDTVQRSDERRRYRDEDNHWKRRPERSRENSPERSNTGKGVGSEAIPAAGLSSDNHWKRRSVRSRETSPERSSIGKGLAAVGVGGIAAAGLAGGLAKDTREKEQDLEQEARKERRHRRHRERSKYDEDGREEPIKQPRDKRRVNGSERELMPPGRDKNGKERSDSDSVDDPRSSHSQRRRHHDRDGSRDNRSESESDARIPTIVTPIDVGQEQRYLDHNGDRTIGRHSPSDRRNSEFPMPTMQERTLSPFDRTLPPLDRTLSPLDHTLSPGDSEDGRQRRVQLVEPPKDKSQEMKPKGILKPSRAVPFPEDPNPTREGVAPLKEAGKQGVPPGARWTKISRQLVNPAALKKAQERFEEREDYVIVLRVLTKEEISKFAEKTREIRDQREQEWQDELNRKKHVVAAGGERQPQQDRNRDRDSVRSSSDEDNDDDDERGETLKIEAPPPHNTSHPDSRQPSFDNGAPLRTAGPEPSSPPQPPAAQPAPAVGINGNYSENV